MKNILYICKKCITRYIHFKMRVLVTGGFGLVGHSLQKVVNKRKATVSI